MAMEGLCSAECSVRDDEERGRNSSDKSGSGTLGGVWTRLARLACVCFVCGGRFRGVGKVVVRERVAQERRARLLCVGGVYMGYV